MVNINDKAPDFAVPDQDDHIISLKNFKGKWLVIYFYPRDNTPGCTTEAIDFTTLKPMFGKLNAYILGVSKDSKKSHCTFIEKHDLNITLLSDEEKKMIQDYGVWAPKKFMGREFLGVVRSTFLINPQGKVAYIWSNVRVKEHAVKVLEKLKELQ